MIELLMALLLWLFYPCDWELVGAVLFQMAAYFAFIGLMLWAGSHERTPERN